MNYNYNQYGEPFLEVTFPTRKVKVALFKYEDVRKIYEKESEGKPIVTLLVKNVGEGASEWYFDGTMEEFKKNCKLIYF